MQNAEQWVCGAEVQGDLRLKRSLDLTLENVAGRIENEGQRPTGQII